jgi:hypothetical protein
MSTVRHSNIIKLGTRHKTAADFRRAFEAADCWLAAHANDILDSDAFHVADTETEIKLVAKSVADLGFRGSAAYSAICARARELGLALCPAEVGPQLRLQYRAQPPTHFLHIAMEPILHSSGHFVIFSVDRSLDARYLATRSSAPDHIWFSNTCFVFSDPR